MAKSNYRYGRRKENQVAKSLRRKNYEVVVSRASRGASDVVAEKGAKRWAIQVKASRKRRAPKPSSNELRRLKIQARKTKATPVLAQVTRGRVRYHSARTNRRLKP